MNKVESPSKVANSVPSSEKLEVPKKSLKEQNTRLRVALVEVLKLMATLESCGSVNLIELEQRWRKVIRQASEALKTF